MSGSERTDGEGAARDKLALRLGLAGALGIGALVTGFILTRPGRRLMGDVLAGRRRTPLEGRVLDAFWSDRILGRRRLDVRETGPGQVVVRGTLATPEEVGRALALGEGAEGVREVRTEIEVDPAVERSSFRRLRP